MSWKITPTYDGLVSDADATAYLAAVQAADGQLLEPAVRIAVNNFIVGCKADGIWTAIKASCILAGARTLEGALVPLVGAAPTNVGGLFVSGDYNRETGLQGNGTTKRLNSGYKIPDLGQNNAHAACRASAIAGSAQFLMGDGISGGRTNISVGFSTSQVFSRLTCLNQTTLSEVPSAGFYGVRRSESANYTLRSNGTDKTISQSSATPVDANMGVFTTTISPAFYFAGRIAFYSIGESLDLALLDARVTDLINAFGATIP
jgi:hypothetical protein